MVSAVRTGLPIAVIARAPVDADNPAPVPIVAPVIAVWVVMPSIGISVVSASVIISRSWRWNKTGNTEHNGKQ